MTELPADLAAAVRLGGEMGRRFADHDWDTHPLGHPGVWPAPVRSLVAVALTSRFPIVLWLGDDLSLVYNDGYIPMLGDRHPAALGRAGRQVWWDVWEAIAPMLSGVVASGEATWSADLMLPLVTEGWAQERYFTFSYSPIILPSGKVDGVFCAVAETTDRVLGERRLHLLNDVAAALMPTRSGGEAVEALVDACDRGHPDLPFLAVYLDGEGPPALRAGSPHAAAHLPRGIEDAASRVVDLATFAPGLPAAPDQEAPTQALLLPVGERGQEHTTGVLVAGLNPRRRLDERYRAFLRLLADQLSAAITAADSYRRQQDRAEQLAELDRAKTAFLTNVSHEFRTPLTLLLGPLQDAIDTEHDPARRQRLVLAHRNGQRLLRLVNSLLDFSRIEAGRAVIKPRPLDLGRFTAQLASSFAGACERAGIDLVLDCASVTADVDPPMWETVVLNLLSNAVKFTHRGTITVRVEQLPEGGGRLRVTDTGTGVPAGDLDRLFERFYRASNTDGRSVEGSGIGLSLVSGIVDLHGGTVAITSQEGHGTTVTVDLPASLAAGADPLPAAGSQEGNAFVAEAEQWLQPARAVPAGPRGTPTVLIVDDNADMRAHLDGVLSPHWATILAGDGRTALAAAREHRPALVITDVMMPGLDGFAFTQALRADPDLAATPVLMLSARAGAEAAGDGFTAGADGYLTKPFTSAELVHRVEASLNTAARQHTAHAEQHAKARQETAAADLAAAITAAGSTTSLVAALLHGPFTATAAAIGVRDRENGHLTVHYGGDIGAELRDRYHRIALDAPVPLAQVAATGQPMTIPDVAALPPRFDQVVRDAAPGVQASVIHPLHDPDGGVIGALALLWPRPRQFDEATLELVAAAAALTGQSLARIRSAAREHHIATVFQDHLLDLDRGSTDAVVAAVYEPSAEAMRVGGDWYLTIPVRPGQVSVCVGDVVGHGLPAATVMGKLRAAVAATALSSPAPAPVLAAVQRYAATIPGALSASLAYAAVDTAAGTVDYLCAGHPYPLLVTPGGRIDYLDQGRMPTLAAFASHRPEPAPARHELPPGSMLVCYTDGLIERRGETLTDGFARLAAAASDCAALPAELACRELLRRLAPGDGYHDDVVILALRPAGVTDSSFVAVIPADPTRLAPLRARMRDWLGAFDLPTETFHNILIAAGEALINGIEHGSRRDPSRTVSIEAFAHETTISVSVTDGGQWRADTAESRRRRRGGRGLTLMHGMAAQVDIHRGPRGTTVTLRFHRAEAPAPPGGSS